MKIKSLKIKSFRTITTEQTIYLENGLTLVGPNNSGKTNILLGLLAFFTGYEQEYDYRADKDLPFNEKNVKSSLTCTFVGDPTGEDQEVFEKLKKLRELLNLEDEDVNEFSINVYFTNDNPVYQVFAGVKRPPENSAKYSLAQKNFISNVLDEFQWYYIPSNKSILELYTEFVSPFLKEKVAKVLEPYDHEIRKSISTLTSSMNNVLKDNGLEDIQAHLEYPNNSLIKLISGFELFVQDQNKSSIFSKGMGLQAAVLLSSFKWITEQQSNKKIIWLIEEPETYMHPGLAMKCSTILDELSKLSTVIKTTHAINFIPAKISQVQGVRIGKQGNTIVEHYDSHLDATEEIRLSLGVKFADYFGLAQKNIFVEGETDREYLNWVINKLPEELKKKFDEVQIRDFEGVTDLKGFLRANYDLIRKEVCVVSLFDGDEAGIKAIGELSGFFGKKGGFNANNDYVLIPDKMAIESLFPMEWVKIAYAEQDAWFEKYIIDAKDDITFFSIRDKSKKAYMSFMMGLANVTPEREWIPKFLTVLTAIDKAVTTQSKKTND